jgi:hypothetical protein
MEVFKFNILPMEDLERRQAFKEAINNCPLCGTSLKFEHEIDFLYNKVTEECQCAACSLKIRSETHDLQ